MFCFQLVIFLRYHHSTQTVDESSIVVSEYVRCWVQSSVKSNRSLKIYLYILLLFVVCRLP